MAYLSSPHFSSVKKSIPLARSEVDQSIPTLSVVGVNLKQSKKLPSIHFPTGFPEQSIGSKEPIRRLKFFRFSSSESVRLAGAGKARVVALSASMRRVVYAGNCMVVVLIEGEV